MTKGHCHDWFKKWKREHNFCGLRPQDAKEMDRYIELSEKLAGVAGKDEDFIHDHFTAGAARPLLRCKDDNATTKAMNYVVACLKREEMITGGDLQATIDVFLGKEARKPAGSTQLRTPEPPTATGPSNSETDAPPMQPLVIEPDVLPESYQIERGPIVKECRTVMTGEVHVHPGPAVMVSPVVIDDTLRERPAFVTAAQLKAHEADPLGIGPAPVDPVPAAPAEKTERDLFMEACQAAYDHGKPDFRLAIDEMLQYRTSWKNPGTVIYFCVTDPKGSIAGRK